MRDENSKKSKVSNTCVKSSFLEIVMLLGVVFFCIPPSVHLLTFFLIAEALLVKETCQKMVQY